MYWHYSFTEFKIISPQPSFYNDTQTNSHGDILCKQCNCSSLPDYAKRFLNWLQYLRQLAQNLQIWVFPVGPTMSNALKEIFPWLLVDFGLNSEQCVAINCIQMIWTLCKLITYFVLNVLNSDRFVKIKCLVWFRRLG